MITAIRRALPRRRPRTPPPPAAWILEAQPQGHTLGDILRMQQEWAAEDEALARDEVAPPPDEVAEAS